ncbi:hypothetical protein MHYP_G00066620 [Metynnis hypsauchen]
MTAASRDQDRTPGSQIRNQWTPARSHFLCFLPLSDHSSLSLQNEGHFLFDWIPTPHHCAEQLADSQSRHGGELQCDFRGHAIQQSSKYEEALRRNVLKRL